MQNVTFRDSDRCAEVIVDRVGPEIRLAIPMGVGKPLALVDALYRLAEADPKVQLTIFTGLTLVRPRPKSTLERRYAGPLLDRVLAGCREPLYADAVRQDRLPPNIRVHDFFLLAGTALRNKGAQRNYVSLNYSEAAAHLARSDTNVLAQLAAPHASGSRVSLSSNPDVTLDLLPYIARRRDRAPTVFAAELNTNLPYMAGDAEIDRSQIDVVLEPEGEPYALFAPPKEPVSAPDYAMALYAAGLIRDGGTLQIGIGSFADALTHALVLRHTGNAAFRDLLDRLGAPLPDWAELDPFEEGLYGCSEMLVDGFLALRRAGVLKRRVTADDGRKVLLHAGFFVGNRAFYDELRAMPEDELAEICMTGILFTNTLRGDAARKEADRRHARFVNTAMTATLLGAVSSDMLGDARVVSGVGGQHDLVTVAHQLPDARAIIAVRSRRHLRHKLESNLTLSYANATLPRALRDTFVTEYGIADVRGKSDRDTIAAMISVADSHFQRALIKDAQKSGKLESSFAVPDHAARNHIERLEEALGPARASGLLPAFPLGSDMTEAEESLTGPLLALKRAPYPEVFRTFLAGMSRKPLTAREVAAVERLELAAPARLKERALRALVVGALRRHSLPLDPDVD